MSEVDIYSIVLGAGNGIPVVILHGWGQDSSSLLGIGELLADDFEVHLLDLPGFGKTSAGERVWSVGDYWQSVSAYIQQRGWERAILIGHSLGGRITIKAASESPEMIERIVLIAAAGIKPRRRLRQRLRLLYIAALRCLIRKVDKLVNTDIFKQWFVPRYASADYFAAGPMRATLVKCVNEDLSEAASRIPVPALLLWGSEDGETPLEVGERLQKLIKNSRLKVIAGEGHYPFLGAGAHACSYEIRKFLAARL